MKCTKCGYEFEKGNFCPECGQKLEDIVNDQTEENADKITVEENVKIKGNTEKEEKSPKSVGAIILFILSIFALLTSCCLGIGGFVALPVLIVSIVFLIKKNKSKFLWVSLILSIIALVVSIIIFASGVSGKDSVSDNKGFFETMFQGSKNIAGTSDNPDEKNPEDRNVQEPVTDEKLNSNLTDNNVEVKETNRNDAYLFINISEDELISRLGYEKNEFGIYPSFDNPIFMCDEGYVKSIVIDNDDEFSYLDVNVGDNQDKEFPYFYNEYELSNQYDDYLEYRNQSGTVTFKVKASNIIAICWTSNSLLESNEEPTETAIGGYNNLYDEYYCHIYFYWDRDLGKYVECDNLQTIQWYFDDYMNSKVVVSTDWGLEYIGYLPNNDIILDKDGWWNVELKDDEGNVLPLSICVFEESDNTININYIIIEDYDDFYSRNLAGLYYNDYSIVPAAGGDEGSGPPSDYE